MANPRAAQIRVVAFDFDGTLVDSNEIKSGAFFELASGYSRGRQFMGEALAEKSLGDRYLIFERFASRVNCWDPDQRVSAAQLTERYTELCEERIARAPDMDGVPGVFSLLARLKIPAVISSATPEETLKKIISRRPWSSCIRHIWGTPSTKEAHIQTCLRHYGCQPGNLLYVGDSEADQAAARSQGCLFLGVGKDGGRFATVPDHFIASLKDFPRIGVEPEGLP